MPAICKLTSQDSTSTLSSAVFHSVHVFTTAMHFSQSILLLLPLSSQAKTPENTKAVHHSFASVATGEVCSLQGWDAPLEGEEQLH